MFPAHLTAQKPRQARLKQRLFLLSRELTHLARPHLLGACTIKRNRPDAQPLQMQQLEIGSHAQPAYLSVAALRQHQLDARAPAVGRNIKRHRLARRARGLHMAGRPCAALTQTILRATRKVKRNSEKN